MRKATTLLTLFVAFIAPLWFLPLSPNPIGFQKQYLLFVVGVVFFVSWALQSLRQRRILFSLTPITIASAAITGVTLLSAAVAVNPQQQLFGRSMLVWSSFLVILFGTTLQVELRWARLLRIFLWMSAVLSLLMLLQFTPWNLAVALNAAIGTNFPSTIAFSLAESPLAYLSFALPVSIAGLFAWKELTPKHKAENKVLATLQTPFLWVGLNLFTASAILFTFLRDETVRPILLPIRFGWGIAVENFKAVPTLLLGVGPESFLMAFHRFRDVSYNMTPLWSTRFAASSNEFLHTLTTTGLLGTLAWLGFWVACLMAARLLWKEHRSLSILIGLQTALFFLLPMSSLSYITLSLTVLALVSELRERHPHTLKDVILLVSAIRIVPHGEIKTLRSQAPFTLVFLLLLTVIMGLATFFAGRIYASQVAYTLSLHAAQRNQVTRAYQLQQTAIRLNPTSTALHRAYAATNIAIARSLGQQGEMNDEQRELFAQLLQQSIRESRLAAQITPQETENWETLSSIYTNLLNVDGAQDWATAGMVQAIQTDPISPQLRSNLGSLYLSVNKPDEALRLFEQTIQLKPDWNLGYVGYGRALASQQEWKLALQAYQRALQLSEEGSDEHVAIQNLINETNAAIESQPDLPAEEKKSPEVPAPQAPTVPTQPQAQQPEGFGEIIEQQPSEPASSENGSIVLPQEVGF